MSTTEKRPIDDYRDGSGCSVCGKHGADGRTCLNMACECMCHSWNRTEQKPKRPMTHCNVSLDDETRRQLQSMADANEHNPGNLAAMVRLLIRQEYKRGPKHVTAVEADRARQEEAK